MADEREVYHIYAPQDLTAETEADRAISDELGRKIAETYLTSANLDPIYAELQAKEDKSSKVNAISQSSTNDEYPSAKATFDFVKNAPNIVEIAWSALKSLRDNAQLVPGRFYRIIDYVTTTSQVETQSAGHAFDVIVVALSNDALSENASAIQHRGDEYFANSKLSAWKLLYSIDNDASRFGWADATNGKGVIYRMIDEFDNDVPYDFKNIQFKRYKVINSTSATSEFDDYYYGCKGFSNNIVSPYGYSINDNDDFIWLYTFGGLDANSDSIDMSIQGNLIPNDEGCIIGCYKNVIGACQEYDIYPDDLSNKNRFWLGNNVFFSYDYENESCFFGCYSNAIGSSFYFNTFGADCVANVISSGFHRNAVGGSFSFNVIGNDFYVNNIGSNALFNVIGSNFYSNSIESGFSDNVFGNTVRSNRIGEHFYHNTAGNEFNENTIGSNCTDNSFGNYCSNNVIGASFSYSSIGNSIRNCVIGTFAYNSVYARYCKFDDGIRFVTLTSNDASATSSNQIQNVHVHSGIQGTSSARKTIAVARNLEYETNVVPVGSVTIEI